MKTLFAILAVLNGFACCSVLTLFLMFYRKPAKKETPAENFIEKQQFKEHWIIMLSWLLGTISVSVFELNVLWALPFVLVGAWVATSSNSSEKAFQLAFSRTQKQAELSEWQTANSNIARQSVVLPDFGMHLAASGTPKKTMLIYTSWEMDVLSVVDAGQFCTTRIQSQDGAHYCATFDFGMDILSELLKASSQRTYDLITKRLLEDPSRTRNIRLPEAISVGVGAVLGEGKQGIHGPFIPLVIVEVFGFEHPSRAYTGTHNKS